MRLREVEKLRAGGFERRANVGRKQLKTKAGFHAGLLGFHHNYQRK